MRTLYRQRMLKGVITDGRNRQDCLFWRSIHSWHLEGKTGKWKECSTKMSQQQEKELFQRRRRRKRKSSEDIICFFVFKKNRKSFSLGKVKEIKRKAMSSMITMMMMKRRQTNFVLSSFFCMLLILEGRKDSQIDLKELLLHAFSLPCVARDSNDSFAFLSIYLSVAVTRRGSFFLSCPTVIIPHY